MELKDILVQERKKRGWSQEELAARVQVSRQAVSKWETGDALPVLPAEARCSTDCVRNMCNRSSDLV